MYLRKLNIFNFRNYEQISISFEGPIQCFLGKNGSGKTNLLDAIYYLSFTKSSLLATDTQNIRNGESMFSIKGAFDMNGTDHDVTCGFQIGQRKTIREDGNDYTRISDHIGKYPCVLIAPGDIELIWTGGEVRRRFVDSLICQVNREYLERLINYNARLKMRNAMLRSFSEKGRVDADLLESLDLQMVPDATFISSTRKEFIRTFLPHFQKHYRFLSGASNEPVDIEYRSGSGDEAGKDFRQVLAANLSRDVTLQRTSMGPHRDDFVFLLDTFELRRHGSQGQQKSFLISLKLAEFDVITAQKKFKPLLLLDDIFDKLDDDRISKLIRLVQSGTFGQLFITDARPERSIELLNNGGIAAKSFNVENGKLSPHT